MLGESSQMQKDKYCMIQAQGVLGIGKLTETGSRVVVTRGWGEGRGAAVSVYTVIVWMKRLWMWW